MDAGEFTGKDKTHKCMQSETEAEAEHDKRQDETRAQIQDDIRKLHLTSRTHQHSPYYSFPYFP